MTCQDHGLSATYVGVKQQGGMTIIWYGTILIQQDALYGPLHQDVGAT
jgi:hypothetical protein